MTTKQQRRKPDERPTDKEDQRLGSRKQHASEIRRLRGKDRLLTRNYREL